MTSEVKQPTSSPDSTHEPKSPSDRQPGTESEQKGGSEPAKRQAERDWQNSSKEEGE